MRENISSLFFCSAFRAIPVSYTHLYDAETGSVKVGGVDVKDYSLDVLRREVSMVLQLSLIHI